MLSLTKVAVGCADLDVLAARQRARAAELPDLGAAAVTVTRFMPRRADELVGGGLYWIIRHRLVARQAIRALAMAETPWGRRCAIVVDPRLEPLAGLPMKAHQGWRYYTPDAPDVAADRHVTALPAPLLRELQSLWLV